MFARFLAFAGLAHDLHVAEDSQDPGPAPDPAESAEWLREDLGGAGDRLLALPACAATLLRFT